MIDWNIQARAHACQLCEKGFADKEAYHTVLLEEKTTYARRDVCEHCWQSTPEGPWTERPGFISHWQGIYSVPPAQPELIQRETAEGLLRKLAGRQDAKYLASMFILAVMLERKRLLKVKEQIRRDGVRTFIYEQPKTGDVFTIIDPELSLDQLEVVQHDVARLLEHGLEEAPAIPAEAVQPPDAPGPGVAEVEPSEATHGSERN